MSVKRGRLLGEFVIVVVGVLAALWVDDWREARSDRELETHLLEGLRSDLTRDSADIASAMIVAEARAAGADELLLLLGDPDAGRTGRFGNTTDNRIDAHGQDFRRVLAEGGLSANGGASDSMVLTAFRQNPRLIAELKNLRDFALNQLVFHSRVLSSAEAVIPKLDENLEAQR